jgi:hypothetical protein
MVLLLILGLLMLDNHIYGWSSTLSPLSSIGRQKKILASLHGATHNRLHLFAANYWTGGSMIWRATGRVGPHLRKLYNQGSSIGLAVPGLALQFFLGEVHFKLILTSPTAKVPFNMVVQHPHPYHMRYVSWRYSLYLVIQKGCAVVGTSILCRLQHIHQI